MRTGFGMFGRSRSGLKCNVKMCLKEMGGIPRIEDTSDIG